jgi:RNA polymerase-interacting CarD/CdnL/TRCF family regulator
MKTPVTSSNFKVGSYLIDSDQIYKITKIDEGRLYYVPANGDGHHPSVTGSIPEANALAAGFRPLLSAEEVKRFFSVLSSTKVSVDLPIDPKYYKDTTNPNDPFKIIILLKQLWIGKNQVNVNFSGNNRDTLERLLEHLSYEFSLVTNKPKDTVRKKIISDLSK